MGWIGLLSPYLPAVFISPPDPHADEIPTFLNSDRILVVTSGVGIVANESKEQEITIATWCTSARERTTGTGTGGVPHHNHSGLESGKSLAVMRIAKEKGATKVSPLTP